MTYDKYWMERLKQSHQEMLATERHQMQVYKVQQEHESKLKLLDEKHQHEWQLHQAKVWEERERDARRLEEKELELEAEYELVQEKYRGETNLQSDRLDHEKDMQERQYEHEAFMQQKEHNHNLILQENQFTQENKNREFDLNADLTKMDRAADNDIRKISVEHNHMMELKKFEFVSTAIQKELDYRYTIGIKETEFALERAKGIQETRNQIKLIGFQTLSDIIKTVAIDRERARLQLQHGQVMAAIQSHFGQSDCTHQEMVRFITWFLQRCTDHHFNDIDEATIRSYVDQYNNEQRNS